MPLFFLLEKVAQRIHWLTLTTNLLAVFPILHLTAFQLKTVILIRPSEFFS